LCRDLPLHNVRLVRTVGTALLLVASLAACEGAGTRDVVEADQARVATSSTSSPRPTTASERSLPYSFSSERPPIIENSGDSYEAIAQSLLDFVDWLNTHRPDFALIGRAVAPGSNIRDAAREQFEILNRHQLRFYEVEDGRPALDVLSVHSATVSLRYTQHLRKQVLVNRRGQVVDERRVKKATTSYIVVLVRRDDDRWYLLSISTEWNR
jgi:hypothetical protein